MKNTGTCNKPGDIRNTYKILLVKLEKKHDLRDLAVDKRLIEFKK
jgi:hypothetical protein